MKVSQFFKRIPHVLFRMGVWTTTAVVLLLCVLFARLFFAPINLDFARDTVVERATGFLPGWQVSYGAAQIGWDWSAVRPWVLLEDIQLIDRRNRLNATISEAQVSLSTGSLLTGVSLSAVDIKNAHVNITDIGGFSDDTDDSLFDDLFAAGVPTPAVFKPLTEAFSRFGTRLLENAPGLEAVNFSNTTVNIARGETLPVFSVSASAFRLENFQKNLQLAAQLEASLANIPTNIRLAGTATPAAGTLSLTLGFSDISLETVAPALELPEFLSLLKFPLGLGLKLDMTAAQGLRAAAFDASIGEGELKHAVLFPEGAPVDYGLVAAVFDVERDLLTVENIELSLGGNRVSGDGTVYWVESQQNPGLRFDLAVDQATVADVQKYWPVKLNEEGKPRGAREWVVQNMEGGLAKNVRFAVNVKPDGTTPYTNGSFFELLFDFEDVATDYLKTMAPVRGAGGHGVFTKTEFDMFFDSGTIDGLPIGGSKIHMHTIHKRGQGVGIFDIALKGELGKVLELVTPPPVRVRDRIKIDPARLGGNAEIAAKITMPLIKAVPKERIVYDVNVDIKNGRLDRLLGGEGLRDAALLLSLDKDMLSAEGTGTINSVPMEIRWRENFQAGREDPNADTSLMVMSGRLDEGGLLKLGVDVSEYLTGTVQSEATFLGPNLKFRVGYFSADASDARLHVPQLAWEKPSSVPANINGTVYFEEDGIRVDPLTVNGEGIDLDGNISWASKKRGEFGAVFSVAELGKNQLSATLVGRANDGVTATIEAERLDLGPMLARESKPDVVEGTSADDNFTLAAKAQELLLLNGAKLTDVKFDAVFAGGEPIELLLTGNSGAGRASISVVDSDQDMRPLTIQASDGGNLLRGSGLFAHMEGGDLTLYGHTTGWGDHLQVSGALEVLDSTLVTKKKLGADVTIGTVSGLDDYLEGGTIKLDLVKFPFEFREGLLDLTSAKANGPTLGITMEGQIDTRESKINVNGVVVPAYGLNSLLGKIPLVGNLFSGGKGKGLFGVAYRVIGTTDAPKIEANPLSGLAPGFLRLLFEGKKGKVADVEATAPEKAPAELDPKAEDEAPEPNPVPEKDIEVGAKPVPAPPEDKPA